MPSPPIPGEAIARIAAESEGLELLILHGSRARGDAHPGSDWDFGYLAVEAFDPGDLFLELSLLLDTDAIDLVDLDRASGLLRYRAAADSHPLFEAAPGAFGRFWMEAVTFWCDAAPILEAGYEAILEDLGP